MTRLAEQLGKQIQMKEDLEEIVPSATISEIIQIINYIEIKIEECNESL